MADVQNELNRRAETVRHVGRVHRALNGAFERDVGIPLLHWRILTAIDESEGAIPQKAIVRSLDADAGALTRQIQALEASGHIERVSSSQDGRVKNVSLTNLGRSALGHLRDKQDAFLQKTQAGLDAAQIGALHDALSALEACCEA